MPGRNSRNRSFSRENGRTKSGNNMLATPPNASRPKNSASTPSRSRNPRKNRRGTKRLRSISPLLYAARMLIFGVGLSALTGTFLSVWNPASQSGVSLMEKSSSQIEEQQESSGKQPFRLGVPTVLQLGQEITELKAKFQGLTSNNSYLGPGVFLVDLDNGSYVDWNGTLAFSAASTIKLPILIAFFQDVDAGKIRLDETLTMESKHIAGGSGNMQYESAGTEYAALEVATKMIAISDNTATNMLIERLGGKAELNHRFKSWGLTVTQISNLLPDLEGTNTTSPRDLVHLMAMLNQGDLLSLRSRDRALDIMQSIKNNSLLPQGLEAGATIAHKTGDIGTAIADAGIVDMPNGKRYLIAAIVKRPHNDPYAEELIREVSRTAYQFLNESRE
ncbi:MAG: serine hydrolase [Oscillatoria sp. SIO1A7]|nr:serine hydrolase [Oscillatoria sp. SIO1A7]